MFAYCLNNPIDYIDDSGMYVIPFDMNEPTFQLLEESSKNPKDEPPDHPDFLPPKKGNKKVKNPNGKGWGWADGKGNVWVWEPRMHGGEGWVVQQPDGGHTHAYPGGGTRQHFSALQNAPAITVFPSQQGAHPVLYDAAPIILGGCAVAVVFIAFGTVAKLEGGLP